VINVSRRAFKQWAQRQIPSSARALLRWLRSALNPQAAELAWRNRRIRQFFNLPQTNNYVHVFIPAHRGTREVLSGVHRAAQPLNEADSRFYSYCKAYAQEHPELMCREALQALIDWRAMQNSGAFLEGAASMETLLDLWESKLGHAFYQQLQKDAPNLQEAFVQMPPSLIHVLRLNLYVPPNLVVSFLLRIVGFLQNDTSMASLVERIDVARVSPRSSTEHTFPTLIIYLDFDYASAHASALDFMKSWLREPLSQLSPSQALNTEFADHWHRSATVTEGFRLYKRYLRRLGCLSRVYDPKRDFAYALNSNLFE